MSAITTRKSPRPTTRKIFIKDVVMVVKLFETGRISEMDAHLTCNNHAPRSSPRGNPIGGTIGYMEKAAFAAGCFWGVEDALQKVPGVIDVVSGYEGGHTANPSYEQVCAGTTGHAETVEVTFDPATVSYETLVRRFFAIHDPTQMNRQGPDVGAQYRSVIFYDSPAQQEVAEKIKAELRPNYLPKTIATSIEPAKTFWRAEDYHQDYAVTHPNAACHI
jgi:methionine-S-sulfoxide reductase